jgi:hypothetical protein
VVLEKLSAVWASNVGSITEDLSSLKRGLENLQKFL